MSKRDYYETLGVARNASDEELKKAYRRSAMKHHPDRNPDDAASLAAFKECKEAYEVLSDASKRRRYDQQGHAAFEHGMGSGGAGPGAGFGDVGDIFGDIFGNIFGGGAPGRGARRGADIGYVMELDLEDAVGGTEKRIEIPTLAPCAPCSATGSEDGRIDTCATCQGDGRVSRQESVEVRIPGGAQAGSRLRVAGKGNAGTYGAPAGDLFITIQVQPHSFFERDGDNINITVPISVPEAGLGAKIEVPTIDGKALLKIPQGTQNGQKFRLREKGVLNSRKDTRGDQIVEVSIQAPKAQDERTREILRELSALHPEDPRAELWEKV